MSDNPRNPTRLNSSRHNLAISSGSSTTDCACCAVSWRWATAITRNPLAASSATASSMLEPMPSHAASTTSGAPLTVSSVPDTEAENDLPERNGRWAAGSAAPGSAPSVPLAAAAAAACTIATSVACTCGPFDAGAACAAQRSTSSRECPATGRTCATRKRFSLSVPVLSKQTMSTRPSASTERGMRTSAPK
ncbi:Uncharacterised protein [Mycobacterium tuberculosis]|nr:Uncharacterised protein [Mycobacterium tuberculosis]